MRNAQGLWNGQSKRRRGWKVTHECLSPQMVSQVTVKTTVRYANDELSNYILRRLLTIFVKTTWTYNQGVIASGLAALYVARGSNNPSLLDQAEITLDATISRLTVNGILKESCDDAKSSSCNHDQVIYRLPSTKN